MTGFFRTSIVLVLVVLIFSMTVQARIDPSQRCLEEHEQYNSCGTACPHTCKDVLTSNLQKPCTLQCVPGCFCRKGYVRETEEANSRCVQQEACRAV